jgi:hypothetical protein
MCTIYTFEFIEDIRYLFSSIAMQSSIANNMSTPWLNDNYKLLNLSIVCGSPHDIPDKGVYKLPIFQGNNVVSTQDHLNAFKNVVRQLNVKVLDVVLKLFVLSLEDDVIDWCTS